MKLVGPTTLAIALASGVLAGPVPKRSPARTGANVTLSHSQRSAIARGLRANHVAFVENVGQWNAKATYRAQAPGLTYWLRKDGVTFDYHRPGKHNGKAVIAGHVISMTFDGSVGSATQAGIAQKPHTARFMAKKSGGMLRPRAFGETLASAIYPGIDFRSYYDHDSLRYDFRLAPGADPSAIRLKFDGQTSVQIKNRDLLLGTQLGPVAHGRLFAYQMVDGKKRAVEADFAMVGKDVGFKLGAYDHGKPLVIDPLVSALRAAITQQAVPVVYGTYYGGDNGWDAVQSVSADAAGNVYMTGYTQATEFPITTGPYFQQLKGIQNAFIARLQGDAYNIDYSVYFGGSNIDYGQSIAVDQFNNVWIAGVTTSPDFPLNTKVNTSISQPNMWIMRWQKSETLILDPITNPAIQMLGYDGGGTASVAINGFAIVPDPNPQQSDPVILTIAGKTDHAVPEVTTGSFASGDGFMVRYSFAGSTFTPVSGLCEYVGDGLPVDMGGLAVDNQGNVYIAGDVGDGFNNYDTTINNGVGSFHTTNGVYTNGQILQKNDLFVRKYDTTGAIKYSYLLGGSGNDYVGGTDYLADGSTYVSGNCIALDLSGNVYVTGTCNSFDYPRTRGVFGETFDSYQNVVVTKVTADGSTILYSTNLKVVAAGKSQSYAAPSGIAVDQTGNAYVTGNLDIGVLSWPGTTPEDPLPYQPGSVQTGSSTGLLPVSTTYAVPNGQFPSCEPWINVLDATATTLLYGSYLGGQLDDKVYGPYVDAFGDVWTYGWTDSGRAYFDPVNPLNLITAGGALPAGMVTPLGFKHTGDAGQGLTSNPNILWTLLGDPTNGPQLWALFDENRDGFLTKFSISHPFISVITANPTPLPGGLGAATSIDLTLDVPAPVQGADITLDLLTPQMQPTSAASFSSSDPTVTEMVVHVPGGATTLTAPVPAYTNPVTQPTQVLVRGFYQGNFLITSFTVVPWLQNFTVTPSGVVGGNDVVATVILARAAPNGGVTVAIQSSSGLLVAPTSVNVPAGQISASFTVNSLGVDFKSFPVLTATFLGAGISDSVELDPAAIANVTLVPNRVSGQTDQGLNSVVGTVTLNGLPGPNFPTTTAFVIGNPAGYVVIPTTLNFNGTATATFTVVVPYEPATVTRVVEVDRPAEPPYDYVAQSSLSNLTVDPTPLISFTLDKSIANPGDTVTGTLAVGTTADSNGALVLMTDGGSSVISLSPKVIIPPGATGVSFPIPVGSTFVPNTTVVTITATRGPVSISRQLTVNPSTLSLDLSSYSVLGGNSLTGTITLGNTARAGGETVSVTFSPTGICSATPNPVIVTGTIGTFNIDTIPVTSTKDVTVTIKDGSATASQVLEVRPPSVTGISFTPAKVLGLHTSTCRITLDGPAAPGGQVVSLTNSNKLVANIPPSIKIPAGKTSYQFTVFTRRVSRPLTTTVTATSQGNSVSATLTVVRF